MRLGESFAAMRARSAASGPAIRNAVISRGRSGIAAARSTIELSTTTPILVVPPSLKVTSFISAPLLLVADEAAHRFGIDPLGRVVFLELGVGHSGVIVACELVGVEAHADRIFTHGIALEESFQLLAGLEVVYLQFDPVTVGIAIVERGRRSVIDSCDRKDSSLLEPLVGEDQVAEICVGVREMIESDAEARCA